MISRSQAVRAISVHANKILLTAETYPGKLVGKMVVWNVRYAIKASKSSASTIYGSSFPASLQKASQWRKR